MRLRSKLGCILKMWLIKFGLLEYLWDLKFYFNRSSSSRLGDWKENNFKGLLLMKCVDIII